MFIYSNEQVLLSPLILNVSVKLCNPQKVSIALADPNFTLSVHTITIAFLIIFIDFGKDIIHYVEWPRLSPRAANNISSP